MNQTSKEIKNLRTTLDRLVYFHKPEKLKINNEHAFIYFITISNFSQTTVTLKCRRWIIRYEDGRRDVIDGEGIVGKEPRIAPGESFSYNSYHTTNCNCVAYGAFHGIDSMGRVIHTRIPEFKMTIPFDKTGTPTDSDPA